MTSAAPALQALDPNVQISKNTDPGKSAADNQAKLVFAASRSDSDLATSPSAGAPTAVSKKRGANPFRGLAMWRRKSEAATAKVDEPEKTGEAMPQHDAQNSVEEERKTDGDVQAIPFPPAAPRAVRRVSFSPSVEEAAADRELESSSEKAKAARKAAKVEKARRKVAKRAKREEAKARKEEQEKLTKGEESLLGIPKRRASAELKEESASSKDSKHAVQDNESATRGRNIKGRQRRTSSFSMDRRGIHLAPQPNLGADAPSKDAKSKPARPRTSKQAALCARHARALEKVIMATSAPEAPHKSSNKGTSAVDAKQMRALKRALLDQHLANGIIGELRAMHLPGTAGVGLPSERIIIGDADLLGGGDAGKSSGPAKEVTKALASRSPALAALERVASAHEEAREQQSSDVRAASAAPKASPTPAPGAIARFRRRLSSSGTRPAVAHKAAPHAVQKDHEHLAVGPTSDKSTAKHPVKAVWLDCPECEAAERHATAVTSPLAAVESPAETEMDEGSKSLAATGLAIWGARLWFASATSSDEKPAEAEQDVKTASATEALSNEAKAETAAENEPIDSDPRILLSGGLLSGVSPVSLLLSPGPTAINAAGRASGAFDALGAITAAAVRADAGGIDAMGQVRPPLDRCAIFVHWWGFEITMPPPTMNYLSTAHSISGAFLSFLQTMVISGGVPELLPFVKYISQFVEMEFSAIKSQNRGDGVIVAATFLMPFALVPRPWDYSTERLPLPVPTQPGVTPMPVPSPPSAPKRTSSAPTQILLPLSAFPVVSSQEAAFAAPPAFPGRRGSPSPPKRSPSPSRRSDSAVLAASKEGLTPPATPRASFQLPPGLKLDALAELPEGSIRIQANA
ncbi:hypothetical protein IE81DRAFT_164531 [Ceraceosorus guamensis]|uniref:Uncharacterized protein n=1 Tax=Ceraceosorus guamensis TaxID=1522189 RepID=A0A316W763_9BASI|nr:hypothetical protein IE81DRAFT_164531 [Ceraceosorus guamensis]PWN45652.1 hypothetical protein IE81DRAFT_164531 [Ceraceosorus guamensis]